MNIITELKNANTVLFTDSEFFNKEITGVKNLKDIKELFSIKGDLKLHSNVQNEYEYRLIKSDYKFTLTII